MMWVDAWVFPYKSILFFMGIQFVRCNRLQPPGRPYGRYHGESVSDHVESIIAQTESCFEPLEKQTRLGQCSQSWID